MKKTIKFLLVAVLTVGATGLFAQKFGRIDYQDVVMNMPEMDSVRIKMEAIQVEYDEQFEGMSVEINKKIDELQKAPATMSESLKQMKTREIQELQQRLEQYYQQAQQDMQQSQAELFAPLETKAAEAIKKISKADGIIAVFQTGSLAYLDETAIIDITAKVRTELGIPATANATAPAAQ
jgi:outer membrane protein